VLNLLFSVTAPHQKYIRNWVLHDSDMSPNPAVIITGGVCEKSAKIYSMVANSAEFWALY